MPFARTNPHRFTTTNANKATIDDELNIQTGWINVLDQRIDDVESKGIAGATDIANVGKLPTTDGENINWIKLTLDYFQLRSLTGEVFQNASILQRALGNVCVGTPQLIDLSVTHPKLALTSVYNINIADNTIQLPKMRSSGKKCLVMGTEGSYFYTEKVADNNAQPWYVFCNNPNAASIALNSLVDIWQNTPFTFTGSQLTNKTVNLTKLVTENIGGFLISGAGNTGIEILPVLDTDYWKLPVRTSSSGGKVILKRLDEICANYANSIDGGCLRQNTVTLAKLAQDVLTAIRNNAFATATVSAKGGLLRKTNVASVTKLGTGQYRVTFASQPPSGSTNYNVQISIGGTYSCSWENKTLNSVDVNIYTTTRAYDAPFDIVISDAGT